jgi:purine-binding chemotaxis protein CheW
MADSQTQGIDLESDQLVTFRLAGEELALPIKSVQEIIKLPEITKVPNTPSYVDGIGNLRGGILPIVNLRRRLGIESKERDDATRVVVINIGGVTTGFVVDSVSEVMHIEKGILEPPPATSSGIEGQYLRGIAKIDDGKRLVLVLAEDQILPELAELSKSLHDSEAPHGTASDSPEESEGARASAHQQNEVEQLVTFNVADEEFAVGIMQVKEIIRVTEITPVPKAPEYIVGVLSLRNHLLPIMDLRVLFSQASLKVEMGEKPSQDKIDSQRIIVVELDGVLTGMLVDSVSEVLTLEKKAIEPPPAIVSRGESNRLRGVGKLENGKRLLMLLDIDRLVSKTDKKRMLDAVGDSEEGKSKMESAVDKSGEEMQLVCFKVDREEYAISIMKVQEIIRINEITAVPKTKAYMKGIINLRGTVVPVIDIRTRFGLKAPEKREQCRIVVVNISGKTTGLIVDSVSEVLRVSKSQIEPPPTSVANMDGKFIEGVGKFNEGKRIIVLINVDCLLVDETLKAS